MAQITYRLTPSLGMKVAWWAARVWSAGIESGGSYLAVGFVLGVAWALGAR